MRSHRRPTPLMWLPVLLFASVLWWGAVAGDALAQTDDHAAQDHDDDHSEEQHGEENGEAGQDDATGHGEGHGDDADHGGGHTPHIELPHFMMILKTWFIDEDSSLAHWLHVFENPIFAIIIGVFLSIVAIRVYNNRQEIPGRGQAFVEMIVGGADHMVQVVMGPQGRHYTPFIGTIFVYLLGMNYFGLVPLGKAPTAAFLNNISIALVVFVYVQFTGITKLGPWKYFKHLCGDPKDLTGWLMSPLMFFIELFGEFIKPVSLSLRLFGNVFGEDMVLAIFALLGVVAASAIGIPYVGFPFHVPFLMLSMLVGFIQALVFALLTTVYISLMLPHEHHDEHPEDAQDTDHESQDAEIAVVPAK